MADQNTTDPLISQYEVYPVAAHTHNGTDSPRIFYTDIINIPSRNISVDFFGIGLDGVGVINSDTTLTRDMFYTTLVVNPAATLFLNGYRVFASQSIQVSGTISVAGGQGGDGTIGGSISGTGNATGGGGGTAGIGIATGTIRQPGNGTAGIAGLAGGVGSHANGNNGTNETEGFLANNGVLAGGGGTGAINSGTGFSSNSSTSGSVGTITQVVVLGSVESAMNLSYYTGNTFGVNPNPAGAGGGGGGLGINSGDARAGGGGGAGSGAAGGILWLCSPIITVNNGGTLTAKGGKGGKGGDGGIAGGAPGGAANYGGGGGGGGAGGNGGAIILIYESYENQGTVTVGGGLGGNGGLAGSPSSNVVPTAGTSGTTGNTGTIFQFQLFDIT